VVELRPVLESALRVVQNEIRHRARMVIELGEVSPVIGNAQRLEQVFLNLLVNAVQALPDGRPENEVRLVLRPGPDSQVVVEVTDNGSGISPELVARVFDPFFTTKGVGIGMGLGLSICHSIVTSHGGSITVTSEVGRGSAFRVTLPASPRPAAAKEQLAAAMTDGGERPRRVLVVDDEVRLCEVIRRLLPSRMKVDIATDARGALQEIESANPPYDLVLCDLMMMGMTGMELHAAVAARRPGLERRFVFMTGGAFTPGASQFLAQQKNPWLQKPIDSAALLAAVSRVDFAADE
jgi:CheY-like chemotaxis protein